MSTRKILGVEDLAKVIAELKVQGKSIVHCHGVFDLLHIGHIKHLESARGLGDVLVVTITPDQFVDKGPHRPAFNEGLRVEALASLSCVDYVAINQWPTAVEIIHLLKPDLYVKGVVRDKGKRDFTDAIRLEEEAVEKGGGHLILTEEETYSATTLINRYLDIFTPATQNYLTKFRTKYQPEEIVDYLQSIRDQRVMVIGETIIDEYQFCSVMAKANKDPVLAARHLYTEKYAGGGLAIANHVSNFCSHVGLLTQLGELDPQEEFIRSKLNPNVAPVFEKKSNSPTIVKRRFLEEYLPVKLFEVYTMRNEEISEEEERVFLARLDELLPSYDVVIVADYGHGLMTPNIIRKVCEKSKFLAVCTQTNAGNKGFNTISKYPRADYIELGEPELRLDVKNDRTDLRELIQSTAKQLGSTACLITRGKNGCLAYHRETGFHDVPPFSIKVVDRIGAGDSVLAITAPCVAGKVPMDAVGFIANVTGAIACTIIGNKSSIGPTTLYRHLSSLLK
ncbi:MAG: PfkB family carbohydrate kinase [Lentisphaerota bacterium]